MKKLQLKFMTDPEDLAAQMCDDYCKWPAIWDEEKMGYPLADSDICKNCPLNTLEVLARDD